MTKPPELRPRPFCGGKAVAGNYTLEGAVNCKTCGSTIFRRHHPVHDPAVQPDEAEKWKRAFAAQSSKLQAVLHIPGVKDALAEWEGKL